jgi:hypothetical protein
MRPLTGNYPFFSVKVFKAAAYSQKALLFG